jgi:hypothetical protein
MITILICIRNMEGAARGTNAAIAPHRRAGFFRRASATALERSLDLTIVNCHV